jgi:hypothetical protein
MSEVSLQRSALVLRSAADEIVFTIPLGDWIFFRAVVNAIEARRLLPPPPVPTAALAIARQGRPIPVWRAAIDAMPKDCEGNSYRAAAVDHEALLAVAADVRHEPDLRAGAVYALLSGAPDELRASARALVGEASPPVVLLMARLSPLGLDLPIGAALEAATPFLDEEQSAALAALAPGPARQVD